MTDAQFLDYEEVEIGVVGNVGQSQGLWWL